jgi:hypothetical protein
MGGTLPAAARAVETPDDRRRRSLAVLYAANAAGALAGTLLATFYALERGLLRVQCERCGDTTVVAFS